jgi:hypothetical protein
MIQLADYFMGRDREFGHLLGHDLRHNAGVTVEVANKLLVLAKTAGVSLEASPRTGSIVSSGWRPPAVNSSVPGAAVRSKHLSCQAIDLYDPDGDLDEWCLAVAETALRDLGLWLEHPAATKGWCHVQTVPPRSGRRVFYP